MFFARFNIHSNASILYRRYKYSQFSTLTNNVNNVLSYYKEQVVNGQLNYDDHQYKLIKLLQKLKSLIENDMNKETHHKKDLFENTYVLSSNSILNDSNTKSTNHNEANTPMCNSTNSINTPMRKQLKGLYIHGKVGTGKTMIMDIFYNNLNILNKKKCRIHFHDFMLDIHQRIHKHKKQLLALYGRDIHLNLSPERDSILFIAKEIASEIKVLCFDEFQVTDICDAMIIHRLFAALWTHGIILVATSNRPPNELYLNGLNRSYFLPFISNLTSHCIVRDIQINKDYRLDNISLPDSYYVPNNEINKQKLINQFYNTLNNYLNNNNNNSNNNNNNTNNNTNNNNNNAISSIVTIPVMMGRSLQLTHAHLQAKICLVDFNSLCKVEKGAADYHALCSHFHTVYMYDVPELTVLVHNEARRFITLIDALYNQHLLFIWCANQHPNVLFRNVPLHDNHLSDDRLSLQSSTICSNSSSSSNNNNNSLLGIESYWLSDGTDNSYIHSRKVNDNTIPQVIIASNDTNNNVILPVEHLLRGAEMKSTTLLLSNNNHNNSNNSNNSIINNLNSTTSTSNNNDNTNNDNVLGLKDVSVGDNVFKVLDGELASIQELSFAFKRASSRLIEMSGSSYRDKWKLIHKIN